MIKFPKPTLYWIGTKTTVFQKFSGVETIDKRSQYSWLWLDTTS